MGGLFGMLLGSLLRLFRRNSLLAMKFKYGCAASEEHNIAIITKRAGLLLTLFGSTIYWNGRATGLISSFNCIQAKE